MIKIYGVVRLARDPEVKDAGQTKVVNTSVAAPREVKREGQPDVDFHNITLFGKRAEALAQYCQKGSQIFIEGALQNDTYTDKDGKTVTRTNIIVSNWQFAGPKPAGATDAPAEADGLDEELPFN